MTYSTFIIWLRGHASFLLACLLLAMIVMHFSIVDIAPLHWQDEIQITEMTHGGIIGKDALHSLVALSDDGSLDRQSWALYWVGSLCSNFAYDMVGRAGPRILQLLWLAALSMLVFVLARRKTGDSLFALVLSVITFAYQPINVSARSGRVDAQAMFFVLLSVYLLGIRRFSTKSANGVLHLLAGISAAMAVFTWITSIVTMPIILCEFACESRLEKRSAKEVVWFLGWMLLGGFIATLSLLSPFLCEWSTTTEQLKSVLCANLASSGANPWQMTQFTKDLASMPGICVIGAGLLFAQRRIWIAALGFTVFALISMRTKSYAFRIVYCLPYTILSLIYFRERLKMLTIRRVLFTILCVMAVTSVVWVVFARSVFETFARPARDYAKMEEILRKEIGEGSEVRIYVATHELGYVSRNLGWYGDNFGNGKNGYGIPSVKFLERDDYVIAKPSDLNARLMDSIEQSGFVLWKEIPSVEPAQLGRVAAFLKRRGKLNPLGPYQVYRRKTIKQHDAGGKR